MTYKRKFKDKDEYLEKEEEIWEKIEKGLEGGKTR